MVLDSLLSAMSKSIELDINLRDFDFNVVFETILRIHGISHDQGGSIERRRGQPGAIVTDEDREMLMLAPLRVFIPGEIVAIEGKDSSDWKLIDGMDVIVHIFIPEKRKFYELEKMWSELIPKEKVSI